jgi:hypothetical protein
MMWLDKSLVVWFNISAHGLTSARDGKVCFRQSSRPQTPVQVVLTMSQLVCGVMATARKLLLCHRSTLQMGCGIIKDGGDLIWTSIVRCLSSDPKCFFHELVETLDCVIELRRGLPQIFQVEIA